MPSRPTGLRPLTPSRPSGFGSRKAARRWLACMGMLGALCANDAAQAQPRTDAGTALVEQGNYWQGQGRADLAEESWRKLLQVDPQSADAMAGMARVELSRSNAEAARGWLARLRTAHPQDNRLARLQQEVQNPGAQNDLLQRARAAARAGRAAEAVQLYRSQFDNGPPPESLALEYFQVLSSTPQGADEGRRGLEQLVRDHPDNPAYQLALAQLKTYSEATRREGIRALAGLSKQPAVAAAARASWRQALIWLDARAPDAPLYRDYLGEQNDEAVAARLENLTHPPAASAASAAGQAVGEGFRALDRSDLATAERTFDQTLRAQPDDTDALGGMGLVRLRQERFAQAEELLTRASRGGAASKWASALRSASYWNLIGQANAARDKNDLRGQQALLERAVKLDAREPTGQIALADNRLAAGDLAQAEALYQRVLSTRPDDAQALRGLITTYGRQGRTDDALALAKRLPADQAGQLGGLRDIQVEQARAHAKAQGDAGDVAGAQRTLEDAMLAAPDSPWVRLDLANIYRRQGLVSEARGVMDGLLMSQPDMPDALYASALLASDSGDATAGLQYLDRIPAASRTRDMSQLQRRLWAQGQAQRAEALVRQGNPGAARQVLAQAESSLSSDMPAEIWGELAGAYAEIGDAPRALAMSRQLLARNPSPGIGDRLLYASILLKTRQDVELSAVLRQLQNAPLTASQRSDFDSLRIAFALRQTDALREAGNLEAAYNAMAPVLAARPEDPQALAALARLYSAARDERQALALYQHILQRSPTDLDVLLASASSASALREHEEAKNYVMAALKIAPDQSRTLAAAGRVYRNAGDGARAEQYLRAALVADGRSAGTLPMAGTGGAAGLAPANPFAGMTGGAPSLPMAAGYPVAAGNPFAGQGAAAAQPGMLPAGYPMAAAYPAGPAAASPFVPTAYPGSYPAATGYPAGATADGNAPWPAAGGASRTANSTSGTTTATRNGTRAARGNANSRAGTAPATAVADNLPPLPPIQPMQPGAYPVPGSVPSSQPYPSSYPAPPYGVAGAASDTSGWNPVLLPSAPRAPANPVQSELDDLAAQRSTSVSIGTVLRSRAGESGLSSLTDFEVPIQARFPAGEGKIVVGVTPTFLDAGQMSGDFATASRFGGGPSAAYNQSFGTAEAPGSQTASGVGLSVGYEGKNLNANIGTTPLGFPETNVIGNVTLNGNFADNLSYKVDLSRRPVTDSLLSFAGTKDPRTNDSWGGVLATGGRLEMTYDDGTYGLYGYGSAHSITGTDVESNSRLEGGLGLYMHLMDSASSHLTAGMNLGLLGYDKNLSYFTFGQGGYFSPQRFVSVAFPVDWSGRNDRLAWRVNASLGFQSFTQDSSSYFPTDPSRLGAANSAATAAAALGLFNTAFTGKYPSSSKTGLAYNIAAVLEYQLAPRLYLGGSVGLSNAQNYRQFTGGVHVRYMFDGATSLGGAPTSGMTLNPLTSPYTPLL